MKVSFEGIGEMVVTFDNGDSGIPGGKVVKMAGNSAVAACVFRRRLFSMQKAVISPQQLSKLLSTNSVGAICPQKR